MEKIIIITQARIGSTRFHSKILKKVKNQELLSIHLKRLKKSKLASSIVVATTFEENVDKIISIAKKERVKYFQGSTYNVLDRFYKATSSEKPNYIVRVTSDCPLIDWRLIDEMIEFSTEKKLDYCSNALIESYPDGQDIEVIKWEALEISWENANSQIHLEHVTPYIRENSDFNNGKLFSSMNFGSNENYGHIRMTVDEFSDLEAIQTLVNRLGIEEKWETYSKYIIEHPEEFTNQSLIRNEGYLNSLKNN